MERVFQVTTTTSVAVGISPATRDVQIVLKNNKNHSLSFSREEWDMIISNLPKIKGADSNYVFGNIEINCLKIGLSDGVKISRDKSYIIVLHSSLSKILNLNDLINNVFTNLNQQLTNVIDNYDLFFNVLRNDHNYVSARNAIMEHPQFCKENVLHLEIITLGLPEMLAQKHAILFYGSLTPKA